MFKSHFSYEVTFCGRYADVIVVITTHIYSANTGLTQVQIQCVVLESKIFRTSGAGCRWKHKPSSLSTSPPAQ